MSDSQTVEVRRLRACDWATVRDLRLGALREAPEAFGGNYADSATRSPKQWRTWPGDGPVFAAFMDDEPVGMVAGAWPAHLDGAPELIAMWVTPAWRGHGVVGALIAALSAWACDSGNGWLYLEVKPHNRSARASYRRAGFEEVYDRPGRNPAHVLMRLDLSRGAR